MLSVAAVAPQDDTQDREHCDLLIRKSDFRRLVYEITAYLQSDLDFAPSALSALQEVSEAYLISAMEDANLHAVQYIPHSYNRTDTDEAAVTIVSPSSQRYGIRSTAREQSWLNSS